MKQEAPIVIIGAGPIGMFLALDLANYGVPSILVEKIPESRAHPKGNTHNARTMEHYRRVGLADDIRRLGIPSNQPTDVVFMTRLDGFEFGRIVMPSSAEKIARRDRYDPLDQVPEPLHRANQMDVESYVMERVKCSPLITTLFEWEFLDHHVVADGLAVHVRRVHDGEKKILQCLYLVGCDGGRSTVRQKLGIKFQGEDAFDLGFMDGAMRATHLRITNFYDVFKSQRGWQYWIMNQNIMLGLVAYNHKDDFLVHVSMEQAPTDEELINLMRRCAKAPLDIEVVASRTWTAGRALVAEFYGDDRVFLVGDAAHIFTPTGGFGMNTGIDDAANLAWKLTAVLKGWGGLHLLATYEEERRPVGVRNTTSARTHAKHLRDLHSIAELDEDTEAGARARAQMELNVLARTEEFASIGIQLGARYDQSSIIAYEPGAEAPPDLVETYTPSSVPGGRAPHLWLSNGRSLYDLIDGDLLLLCFANEDDAAGLVRAAAARSIPLKVAYIDLPGAKTLYQRKFALVRPDHYVAWRGDQLPDPDALLSKVTGTSCAIGPA
jgi:2-polyprenyl-6-methoxyphenol hydroxylase-like FAD-dependent oxidoreductase